MPKIINLTKDKKMRQSFAEKPNRRKKLACILGLSIKKNPSKKFVVKTSCRLSGACHSVYSMFQLSRHFLRKQAAFGFIPGIRASNW